MVAIENRVDRFIEISQAGRVTLDELRASFLSFQQILLPGGGRRDPCSIRIGTHCVRLDGASTDCAGGSGSESFFSVRSTV